MRPRASPLGKRVRASLVSPRGHVVVPRVGLRFPARLPFEDARQPVMVRIRLTAEQAKLCQLAADMQSLTAPTWAVRVLGHAAHNSLELPATPAPPGSD